MVVRSASLTTINCEARRPSLVTKVQFCHELALISTSNFTYRLRSGDPPDNIGLDVVTVEFASALQRAFPDNKSTHPKICYGLGVPAVPANILAMLVGPE